MKLESAIDFFVLFVIFVKLVFVVAAVGHAFMHFFVATSPHAAKIDPKLLFWKERTEFVFKASMAFLLIHHFRPGHNRMVTGELSLMFFLFGWILLLTADWHQFFESSPWKHSLALTESNPSEDSAVRASSSALNGGNALSSSKFGVWIP